MSASARVNRVALAVAELQEALTDLAETTEPQLVAICVDFCAMQHLRLVNDKLLIRRDFAPHKGLQEEFMGVWLREEHGRV